MGTHGRHLAPGSRAICTFSAVGEAGGLACARDAFTHFEYAVTHPARPTQRSRETGGGVGGCGVGPRLRECRQEVTKKESCSVKSGPQNLGVEYVQPTWKHVNHRPELHSLLYL